eukprot:239931_1
MHVVMMMNYVHIWLMIALLTIIFTRTETALSCMNAYSCNNTEQLYSATVIGGGYRSLEGATIVATNYVHCKGSFSCDSVSAISLIVLCDGQNACASTNIQAESEVTCHGSLSCIHSTIHSNIIRCHGVYSCANTHINNTSSIYGSGAYSLQNVTILSANNLDISLHGYHSGFGGKLHCQTGHHCTINCTANACEMFLVQCDGICTINTHSNYTIPPITNLTSYNGSVSYLLHDAETNVIDKDDACNAQQELNFDNEAEHQYDSDIIQNAPNGEHICCRGSSSCYAIDNIITSDGAIVCNGMQSCFDAATTTINSTNGSIYCAGRESCRYADIATSDNVWCSAYGGCMDTFILNAQKVYCIGTIACKSAAITSSGDMNIYLLGEESGYSAVINCKSGDNCFIICGGANACTDAELICNGWCTVRCNSDTGCPLQHTTRPTTLPSRQPTSLSYNPSASPNNPTLVPTNNPSLFPTMRGIVAIIPSFDSLTASLTTVQTASSLNHDRDGTQIESDNANISGLSMPVIVLLIVCAAGMCMCTVIVASKQCNNADTTKQLQAPGIVSPDEVDQIPHGVVHMNHMELNEVDQGAQIGNEVTSKAVHEINDQTEDSFEVIGDDETPMDRSKDHEENSIEGDKITVEGS